MKIPMVLVIVLLSFFNCKQALEPKNTLNSIETDSSKNTHDSNDKQRNEKLLELGCYAYNHNNTSITFEITELNTRVIGKLNYHWAEKDANDGTFKGVLKDDILLGNYTFLSEGITSEREVVFKIINGQLIEGYGIMNKEGTQFNDTKNVAFNSTMPLTRTTCN